MIGIDLKSVAIFVIRLFHCFNFRCKDSIDSETKSQKDEGNKKNPKQNKKTKTIILFLFIIRYYFLTNLGPVFTY